MTDLEHPFMVALSNALNAPGRATRIFRQNAGKVLVRDAGGRVDRCILGAPAGAADLSGIVAPEGWRLEVETKASGGRVRPAQKRWQHFIERSGGIYVLIERDDGAPLAANIGRAVCAIDTAIAARRERAAA